MNKWTRCVSFIIILLSLLDMDLCQLEVAWKCQNDQYVYDTADGMYKYPSSNNAILWTSKKIIAKRATLENRDYTLTTINVDNGLVLQRKFYTLPQSIRFVFEREFMFFLDLESSNTYLKNFKTEELKVIPNFPSYNFQPGDSLTLCKVGDSIIVFPLDPLPYYYNYTTKTGDYSDFDNVGSWKVNSIIYNIGAVVSYYCANDAIYVEMKYASPNRKELYKVVENMATPSQKLSMVGSGSPTLTTASTGAVANGRYIYTSYFSPTGDELYKYDKIDNIWIKGPKFNEKVIGLSFDIDEQILYVLVLTGPSSPYAWVFRYTEDSEMDFGMLNTWEVWDTKPVPSAIKYKFIHKGYLFLMDSLTLTRYKCVDEDSITITDLNLSPYSPNPLIIAHPYIGLKKCGDGYINILTDEECDDANILNYDGCSSNCQVEPGWICESLYYQFIHIATSHCRRIIAGCGNGVLDIQFDEECDDNNVRSGDGCSSSCQIECGYECDLTYNPTLCHPFDQGTATCGDGIVQTNEECDDPSVGCDSNCKVKSGYNCPINSKIEECGSGCKRSYCTSSCVDIDECLVNRNTIVRPCGKNAVCENTQGSFTCKCPDPLTGDPHLFCSQINFCEMLIPCKAGFFCSNTLTGHVCKDPCPKGFYFENGDCIDVDECALAIELGYDSVFNCIGRDCNYCDPNAICTNTYGSFACSCKAGFVGDGFICAALDCTSQLEGTRCVSANYSSGTCKNLTDGEIIACGGCILDASSCDVFPYSGVFNPVTCSCETVATPCGAIGTFPSGSCCSPFKKDSDGRCQYSWCKTVNEKATYTASNKSSNCCVGLVNVTVSGELTCKNPTLLKSECKIVGETANSLIDCCKGLKLVSSKCQPSLSMCTADKLTSCCYGSIKNTCTTCYCPVGFYK